MIKLWWIYIYIFLYTHIHIYAHIHMFTCIYICMCVCVCSVVQLCLTLQSHDCSSPGSSVHGITQARILEVRRSLRVSRGHILAPSPFKKRSACKVLQKWRQSQARLTKEQRWGSALLSRNHSLEEEFERAKAAVEVAFWFIFSVSCFWEWNSKKSNKIYMK